MYLSVGGDEASDADQAGVGEKPGHLCDATNVLLAINGAETKVLVEAVANIISI